MTQQIPIATDLTDLAELLTAQPTPTAQPIFFHTTEPESPTGPVVALTVRGIRGFVQARMICGHGGVQPDGLVRLHFDDGGSVDITPEQLRLVSLQLAAIAEAEAEARAVVNRREAERLGARLRAEGMNN